MGDYMPRQDGQLVVWLNQFKTELAASATDLGLLTTDVTAITTDIADRSSSEHVLTQGKTLGRWDRPQSTQ